MKRFQSAGQYLIIVLFLLNAKSVLGVVPVQEKPWLKQYASYKAYDGVYVVKKIDVACKVYQSFLVDGNGNKLTPAFKDIGEFSNGLAEFVPIEAEDGSKGLHGFINKRGKVIIPPVYHGTDKFYQGKTWVIYRAGKQFGLSYIDTTGKTIYKIPVGLFNNDFLISKAEVSFLCNQDCSEDIIWWKKDELFILNWNFSRFIEKEIKESKNIYHFLYKGKYGIIDKNMILKIPVVLDDIDPKYKFSGQGMERVKYGDKYGFLNVFTGEMITPFLYSETRKPTNGLFWVKKDGKWGCIDKTGKVRIPLLYDEANGFTREDRAAVAINGKFGHINKAGEVKTPLKYNFVSYYNNGISLVRLGDKYGFIDVDGKLITGMDYDEAAPFDKKTTTVQRSGLRYELTLDGEEHFIGFSYWWNGIFIFIAVILFIQFNSYFFKRSKTKKAT